MKLPISLEKAELERLLAGERVSVPLQLKSREPIELILIPRVVVTGVKQPGLLLDYATMPTNPDFPYVCTLPECNRSFTSTMGLIRHVNRAHHKAMRTPARELKDKKRVRLAGYKRKYDPNGYDCSCGLKFKLPGEIATHARETKHQTVIQKIEAASKDMFKTGV